MSKPSILFIDNFDSFTFNLVDALSSFDVNVNVYRNDVDVDELMRIADETHCMMIVLSPGPGRPEDAGNLIALIQAAATRYPIFGICLGHQAIAKAFGGVVEGSGEIVHGKKSKISHQPHPIFDGLPETIEVGRYHSLTVTQVPDEFQVIAEHDGKVMAMQHNALPIIGVQFHPESILTTDGQILLKNAFRYCSQQAQTMID
jgi:anthranilate synthase component 2